MARRVSKNWPAIVAMAEKSQGPLTAVAKQHGVTLAALKYHLYKSRRAGGDRGDVKVLPVRTDDATPALSVQVGSMSLQFRQDCDPEFIAGVLRALAERPC
jgi:transposase-like protein